VFFSFFRGADFVDSIIPPVAIRFTGIFFWGGIPRRSTASLWFSFPLRWKAWALFQLRGVVHRVSCSVACWMNGIEVISLVCPAAFACDNVSSR
jgi:hypothetical protein